MDRIFPIDGFAVAKRALALVSCTVALASLTLVPAVAQGPTDEQYQALETRLVELVNEERLKVGSNPLVRSDQLNLAAWRQSWDMALNNFASHTGSDGSDSITRIRDTGYQGNWFGENIVVGFPTAETAMNWWMNSPGHRANILDPQFTEIGVALAYNANSDNLYYWTQVFAKPR
jgi:uncharacterized protein YkwD